MDDMKSGMQSPPQDPVQNLRKEMDQTVNDADAAGALEPITAKIKEMGREDCDAKELMKLAQKDSRTRGKKPEEIAGMLDEALYDDLIAYRDGGVLQRAYKNHPEAAEGESETGPPPGMGAMGAESDKNKPPPFMKK